MKKISIFIIFSIVYLLPIYAFSPSPKMGVSIYTYNSGMLGLYSSTYDLELGFKATASNEDCTLSRYIINFQLKNEIVSKLYFVYGFNFSITNGHSSSVTYNYRYELGLLAGLQYIFSPHFVLSARIMPIDMMIYKTVSSSNAKTLYYFNNYLDLGLTYLF